MQNDEDEWFTIVLALPKTSIKHWKKHVQRLQRSEKFFYDYLTKFELIAVEKDGYKWGEVKLDIAREIQMGDEFKMWIEARKKFDANKAQFRKMDFNKNVTASGDFTEVEEDDLPF